MDKIDRRTSLASFTSSELLDELARRLANTAPAGSTRDTILWCEHCANFETNPHADESYNPCAKRHEMEFMNPNDYNDSDEWGFFRTVCVDRRLAEAHGEK